MDRKIDRRTHTKEMARPENTSIDRPKGRALFPCLWPLSNTFATTNPNIATDRKKKLVQPVMEDSLCE